MSNLAIKEVEFQGDTLLACEKGEKVYVAVKWVSQGIGLSDGQYQSQTRKIQEDLVVSKGIANLQLPTNGGIQEVLCIELDFLPLWLAKISITPKMKADNPELVDKLVEYQLKAKDVLANAFIHKVPQMAYEDMMIQHLMQMKEVRLKQEEHDRELKLLHNKQIEQESKVEQVLDYATAVPDFKTIHNAINKYSRLSGKSQLEVRGEVYKKISDIYGIDLTKRVNNAHKKIQEERIISGKKPYKQSSLSQKYSKMDVIREEKLEKEVIQILMDMTNELNK